MKNISFESYVAILGFFITSLQLYFPRLSLSIEEGLSYLWAAVKALQGYLISLLKRYKEGLLRLGQLFISPKFSIPAFLFSILAIVSVAVFDTNIKDHSSPATWIFFALMSPYLAFCFLWLIFVLFSIVTLGTFYLYIVPMVYFANKSFHFLNTIGRGKAIGGMGILLALYGLHPVISNN